MGIFGWPCWRCSQWGRTMNRLSLIAPLALVLGVLPACGPEEPMQVELRNHAGTPYWFRVESVGPMPDPNVLDDYDLIDLRPSFLFFSGSIDDGAMAPFWVRPVDGESVVSLTVSVSSEASDSEPSYFTTHMKMSSQGTPWLAYVVRDGDFRLEQGRD